MHVLLFQRTHVLLKLSMHRVRAASVVHTMRSHDMTIPAGFSSRIAQTVYYLTADDFTMIFSSACLFNLSAASFFNPEAGNICKFESLTCQQHVIKRSGFGDSDASELDEITVSNFASA